MSEKVIVVAGEGRFVSSYFRPFGGFAPHANSDVLFTDPHKVLLVVFTGGEDVDPSMYGEKKNSKTESNVFRDTDEKRYFLQAAKMKIPMAGICRGAQFLCAMSGGKLAQHITGHGRDHTMHTPQGNVTVTSTHHQMQLPPKGAKILAWAEPKLSHRYEGAEGVELFPEYEYEGVFYPQTRSLGMQWHPEWMKEESDGYQYTQSLIEKLLHGKL